MATTMTRKEAREAVFCLLYESEFHTDETPEAVIELAKAGREAGTDDYVESVYPGVMAHIKELDTLLGRFSNGWKTGRMSRVSRAVLRLSAYEMLYRKDIPASVSMNEAVELSKTYDDPRARAFVNGILNSVKNEITAKGAEALQSELRKEAGSDGAEIAPSAEETAESAVPDAGSAE